jgi:hypothetical protein
MQNSARVRMPHSLGRLPVALVTRRGLRGMGQEPPPDFFTNPAPVISAPDLPADFFTSPGPVVPAPNVTAPTAPVFAAPAAPGSLPTSSAGPSVPQSFFTNPAPLIPPPAPAPAPPSFPAAPAPVQFVFPSQGSTAPPAAAATTSATSWFSKSSIAGIPNSYLAIGLGIVVVLGLSAGKRRR